jgi:alpha-galactosidase
MKLDCCDTSMEMKNVSYPKWSKALNATGRPIVYSCDTDELIGIFPWTNEERPWEWGPSTCNMWRTWKDIKPYWWSWTMNLAFNIETWDLLDLSTIAHPGAWNDPDMLEVGVGDMTYEESKSHFSLWAMMAAPLILGNDLRHMTPQTLEIISNAEIIAIDQDPLGRQGRRVMQGIDSDIYAKPLTGGAIAVALWNKVNYPLDITLNWSDLGTPPTSHPAPHPLPNLSGPWLCARAGFAPGRSMLLRDLWAHRDLGPHTQSFTAKGVPSTGVIVLKLTPPPGQPALHPLTDPRIYA